ncbi:hypothetical protein ACP4OV_012439 [Aristida adscensionis]
MDELSASSDSDYDEKESPHAISDGIDLGLDSASDEEDVIPQGSSLNDALFEIFKQKKIADLKRKLSSNLMDQSVKKCKVTKFSTPGSGFTRFSVKYFSDVLSSLTPQQKEVIQHYGFGSLLRFDKCIVPKCFVKWIARQFGKSSMPPISFFGNMLKEESLSDEKTFICFMIVALSSFLCPTSNIHPSSKYFAVFADFYDQCKYIIDWFMEMIAKFSVGNKYTGRKSKSLGGCIYYLAVCYLDFVDFGALQVQGGFPRISVWKGEMIKSYSELDQLRESVYGKRPLRNFSSTCYNQAPAGMKPTTALNDDTARQDFDFRKALDDIFGNIFSTEIQACMWDIVHKHHQDECDNYNQKSEILVLEILKYLHTHFCNEIFSSKSHVNGAANVTTNDKSSGSCPMQEFDEVLKEHMTVVEASNEKKTAEVGADNVDDDEVPAKSDLNDDSIPFFLPQKTLLNAFNEVADDNSAKRTSDLPSVVQNQANSLGAPPFDEEVPYCTQQSPKHADANKDCAAEHNFHFSSGAHKSPFPVKPKENSEVQIVGEVKFSNKCANLSKKAEAIYNERNGLNCDGSKSIEVSTSGGKLPVHGPRKFIYPNKAACGPFVMNSKSYPVSVEAKRFYAIICKIGHNKNWSNLVAFRLNKVHVTYNSMAESLKPYGYVDNFLRAAYCRKFFEEVHPSVSKKHYFFSTVGELMLLFQPTAEMPLVKKAFEGACLARKMHLCHLLYFPICFNHHWFLFVVDIMDRLFVFLDSLYSKDDDYQIYVSGVLVEAFKEL